MKLLISAISILRPILKTVVVEIQMTISRANTTTERKIQIQQLKET